ncbi:MAG: phytanoyl-CoA dioxygenase family protein [Candidatus Poribacteria bacterium]|nr:phytanoyl-CoA dioxygenase family protein [Candidatus Poribacteria bacterium]
MTPEEKFTFDLEGYLVIKNVLTSDEIAEMNEIIDRGDREGRPSLWGAPFKKLIDHPTILPYLIALIGPTVRLDHDYAIFMSEGDQRGRLHGGPDVVGDHWYKYRDGMMRNGLSVVTYFLADTNAGDGGFACIPGSHKTNFLNSIPAEVRSFERPAHYVVQPAAKAGDVVFFTEALVHGTMPWRAAHERRSLLYKYSPGHSAWNINYYDISQYGELTEQQKRMLLPPSIGNRPRVVEET